MSKVSPAPEPDLRPFALPEIGITSQEIAWCRDHPEVPEAAALLTYYGYKYATPQVVFRDQPALTAATQALRRIRPRPPIVIDEMFAWINPRSHRGGEDVPGFSLDGATTVMMGADMSRMWALDRYRQEMIAGLGMPMTLYRFGRGPDIPREKIGEIYAPPGGKLAPHTILDTLYALIIRFETGDEGIGGYDHHLYGLTPLVFTRKDAIAPVHRRIEDHYRRGNVVGFRSFVDRQRVGP